MTNSVIRAAFESRLKTWVDAQSPVIPVAFENVPFTQPAGRYLRAFLLPNATQSDDLARVHRRYIGFFQVTLVMPIGTGSGAAAALEQAISALYLPAVPLVSNGMSIYVTQPMSAGPAQQESDRYTVPLSVPYRADTV